ncbi:MAG: hypothetical protein FWF95_00340 [Syntrophorhabdaceae bacterium]|nr:hypothetical protein [Syntrophorhabdaceae bacterium]
MRKGLVLVLAAVLVVAFAAPAMADLKVTGFYRAKAMYSNFFNMSSASPVQRKHDDSSAYTEQRMRIKFDMGTEVARAILHLESDMNWGQTGNAGSSNAGAGRNSGGALSADAVQLETKEAYVWFRVPDTSFTSTVGMQMVSDHYAGIFANNARMTSIFVNGQFEPVKVTLGWGKLFENNPSRTDDVDMYLASAQFAPSKDMNVGVNFYYLNDQSGRAQGGSFNGSPWSIGANQGMGIGLNHRKVNLYMPGVNFAMNAGSAKISAFGFYQFGRASSLSDGLDSFDVRAWALDLRGDLKVGPGNIFVEGFYLSGDDQSKRPAGARSDYRSPITLGNYTGGLANGNSSFTRTRMYFLFGFDGQNVNQCIIGCTNNVLGQSYGNNGNGLWHVASGYSQKFTEKLKGEFNIGYAEAAASNRVAGVHSRGIGLETNVRADYNVSKGLDLSLAFSYLNAGGYLMNAQNSGAKEDLQRNYYMLFARLNYAF